mmetsp:Transcript_35672/g.106461  ORF Transcript_35672/g.106461 Transcript_35672/m.106461 type:complete len:212 (+) Transcript_35672:724-1359(+)
MRRVRSFRGTVQRHGTGGGRGVLRRKRGECDRLAHGFSGELYHPAVGIQAVDAPPGNNDPSPARMHPPLRFSVGRRESNQGRPLIQSVLSIRTAGAGNDRRGCELVRERRGGAYEGGGRPVLSRGDVAQGRDFGGGDQHQRQPHGDELRRFGLVELTAPFAVEGRGGRVEGIGGAQLPSERGGEIGKIVGGTIAGNTGGVHRNRKRAGGGR